ncbi:hypothetical protein AB0O95_09545 [Rhodoglobus sp. NPDC076762]
MATLTRVATVAREWDDMSLVAIALVLAVVALAALALLQVAVAAGLPYGNLVWGGQHRVLPTSLRIGSVISVGLYAFFVLILVDRSGLAPALGAGAFGIVGAWVLVGYFTLGILMNAISRSPIERRVMVPVTLVLAACSLVIALS